MTPIPIKDGPPEAHYVVYAEDQPQYLQLPAIRFPGQEGCVTTKWRLTWKERLRMLLSGSLYLSVLTFNGPLQPIKLGTTLEEVA